MLEQESKHTRFHWTRADWLIVGLLLLIAFGLRLWHLTHTEVAARDSIGFIRIAYQLQQHPLDEWPEVLRTSLQHPGYPLSILAMYSPVRAISDAPEPYVWQWSAQLASALASLLLVIPVYLIGREIFDRRIGFGAALIMQCVPVSGRIWGDGLSESTFVLFAAWGVLWATRALRQTQSTKAYLLTGLFAGLSYLVRPEGVLIIAATGLMMVIAHRRSFRSILSHGTALVTPAVLIVLPYVLTIGALTAKPTGKLILKNEVHTAMQSTPATYTEPTLFAVWWQDSSSIPYRSLWALKALGEEVVEASFYFGWIFFLLGLWWFRSLFRQELGLWMMVALVLMLWFLLWRVALLAGYISSRHMMLILFCGSYWTSAGLVRLAEKTAPRLKWSFSQGSTYAVIFPLLFCMTALPKTMKPLHSHRTGFRQVGEWLASQAQPGDRVLDPFAWTHYYAGQVFLEGKSLPIPPNHSPRHFIIMEDAGNPHKRLSDIPVIQKRIEDSGSTPVHTWQGRRGKKEVKIHVYDLDL